MEVLDSCMVPILHPRETAAVDARRESGRAPRSSVTGGYSIAHGQINTAPPVMSTTAPVIQAD
ncbi:hypothetical protein GCM10028798_31460 [Humibacter antri]